jgi:transposase
MTNKLYFKLGRPPTKTYEMLQSVCGDEDVSCNSASEWFKGFKYERENLQDNPRSGRPSPSRNADTITNVLEMVIWDLQWAPRMMLDELNISKKMIRPILRADLRKRKAWS